MAIWTVGINKCTFFIAILIVVDEGNTLPEWENNNMNASKYISRVTDKRNLEASNEFFVHFVEEVHKKGMRVILDGVFNHCGSFNKWMDAERIYENQYGYEKGAFVMPTVHIAISLNFITRMHGRITMIEFFTLP